MLSREATSETYGPRVYLYHINLLLVISFVIYFAFILLCIFINKTPKILSLSYLSDLTLVSGLIGIDNPYLRWLRGFIFFVQVQGLARSLLLD